MYFLITHWQLTKIQKRFDGPFLPALADEIFDEQESSNERERFNNAAINHTDHTGSLSKN